MDSAEAAATAQSAGGDDHRISLDQATLDEVREILARGGVGAENRPVVFGSRATGRARRYSDLDIGLAGAPIPRRQLSELLDAFEESDLPFRVDIVNLTRTDPSFQAVALASAIPLDQADGASG